ncbi:MAG TPA: HEAT repeat domain-containing protein [Polyangiaceae bacterium]|jgi:HEAT repeat protein
MRAGRFSIAILAALTLAPAANALVWPDVPQRIERALHSTDPGARREAALELPKLDLAQAIPLMQLALGDADIEVRRAAADAAIHLRWAPATEAVLPWLGDRDTSLRVKACEVARAMPLPRAVPALARALSDADAGVRAVAAEALGEQASTDAVAPLLGKLDDPLPPVRIQVVRALARLRDRRAVVPLVGKVQDSVSEVRREVARALGDLGDVRASQALLLQLRDNISEVRLEALRSLGRLRAGDAVDAIAPLAAEHQAQVRQTALEALGRIGTPEAIRVLLGMMGQGDDSSGNLAHTPVRDAIVSAGAPAIPQVAAVLREPTVSTTRATSAAWVLGELGAANRPASDASHIVETVVAAMRRGVLPSAAAMRALGRIGDPSAVPVVLEFALDPSPQVRQEALDAAGRLLDPEKPDGRVVEPLVAALRDPRLQTGERAQIATLLGRAGAARAAAPLVSLAAAKDRDLRLAAIDALGILGPLHLQAVDDGRDDVLVPLLSDTDAQLRLHAALALSRAGGAKARDALLGKLAASEETDRSAVLTALAGVLSRVPTPAAIQRLDHELELSAGADRDALLVAMARAKSPQAMAPLARAAQSEFAEDRRAVATVLTARPASESAALATTLLGDADATVRAQAAWTLGAVGTPANAAALLELAQGGDMDSSIDATAALGRIAARAHAKPQAATWLCPLLDATHPYVRANALAGLALAGARCADPSKERRLLLSDASDVVRAAAARAVRASGASEDDTRALDACANGDRSGAVARLCHAPPHDATTTSPLLVYVVADDAALPTAKSAYAIVLPDGFVHVGTSDRRGAVFDALTPAGEVTLDRPSAARVR